MIEATDTAMKEESFICRIVSMNGGCVSVVGGAAIGRRRQADKVGESLAAEVDGSWWDYRRDHIWKFRGSDDATDLSGR